MSDLTTRPVTFDVMMPYYGDVALMQAAVRSVLAQTDPDWHLTVVDDGKADGVPEWFASLGDERVTYLRNERNLGLNGNFQKCLDLAERDYTVVMGCDDMLLPGYIATVRAALAVYPGVGMVQPGVEIIDGDGKVSTSLVDSTKKRLYAPRWTGRKLLGGEALAASLLRGNWSYFPSIAWRTDAARKAGFDQELRTVLDLNLILELTLAGEQMLLDDTVCFQYRRHAVSASSLQAFDGSRFDEQAGYSYAMARRMAERGWPRAARAARRHSSSRLHAATMLPGTVRRNDRSGARTLIRHVVGTSPRTVAE